MLRLSDLVVLSVLAMSSRNQGTKPGLPESEEEKKANNRAGVVRFVELSIAPQPGNTHQLHRGVP